MCMLMNIRKMIEFGLHDDKEDDDDDDKGDDSVCP